MARCCISARRSAGTSIQSEAGRGLRRSWIILNRDAATRLLREIAALRLFASKNEITNDFRTMGNFEFNGSISGNPMADLMLGEVWRFWQGGGEFKHLKGNRFGLFLQDTWRISPNVTITPGLRWDPMVPYTDTLGRVQCFRAGLQSTRFPNAPEGYLNAGDPGCPEGGFDT